MPKSRKKSYARENKRIIQKFQDLTVNQIADMKMGGARELLKKMRIQFERRAGTHERAVDKNEYGFKLKGGEERRYYSNAYENIKEYYSKKGTPDVDNMPIEKIKSELYKLHDFFNAQGSTVSGARKIAKEQDIRIFGENPQGRPNYIMTSEQRKVFWNVYDEAAKSAGMASAIARSYSLEKNGQEILGQIIRLTDPDEINFSNMYSRFQKALNQFEDLSYGGRVKNLDPAVSYIWRGLGNEFDDFSL